MCAGTTSPACIATRARAALKEREPQYKALAKRVQLRASGGRAAQRAAAKAAAKPASSRRGRAAVSGPEGPELAVTDAGDTGPGLPDQAAHQAEDTGAATPGQPATAGAAQPGSRRA